MCSLELGRMLSMNFYTYIRQKHGGGSLYVVIPAAFARALEKDRGLTTLVGAEVKVEVTL